MSVILATLLRVSFPRIPTMVSTVVRNDLPPGQMPTFQLNS